LNKDKSGNKKSEELTELYQKYFAQSDESTSWFEE